VVGRQLDERDVVEKGGGKKKSASSSVPVPGLLPLEDPAVNGGGGKRCWRRRESCSFFSPSQSFCTEENEGKYPKSHAKKSKTKGVTIRPSPFA